MKCAQCSVVACFDVVIKESGTDHMYLPEPNVIITVHVDARPWVDILMFNVTHIF